MKSLLIVLLCVSPLNLHAEQKESEVYDLKSKIMRSQSVMNAFARLPATEKEMVGFYYRGPLGNQRINSENWQKSLSPKGRYVLLERALRTNNTKAESEFICFIGTPLEIYKNFLSPDLKLKISNVPSEIEFYPSDDSMMIGIKYFIGFSKVAKSFRVESCTSAGKEPLLAEGEIAKAKLIVKDPPFPKALPGGAGDSLGAPTSASPGAGFTILDKPLLPKGSKLPLFSLRADYNKSRFDEEKDRPWKGMDISTLDGAEKFALVVQKYVYENMGNQNTDTNLNFIASKNDTRYWCHMPWLNVGSSGREGIHGLTNERALQKSAIYPDAKPGSDWGVAFYNGKGCQTIERVFGTESSPNSSPKWSKSTFEDGTLSYKILFTTAQFLSIDGAMTWKANVSLPYSTQRTLRDVYHIQMDIAVKDSTLKGINPNAGGWVMVTYYFDNTYHTPLEIKGLQLGLKKMRPQGVQTGFGAPMGDNKDTISFVSAKNNGFEGRLNGPADNPKSSCISCHATAGTTIPMSPGIMSQAAWEGVKDNLDFSQQLSLAKRNVETAPE